MAKADTNKESRKPIGKLAAALKESAALREALYEYRDDLKRSEQTVERQNDRIKELERIIERQTSTIGSKNDAISSLKGQVLDGKMEIARLGGYCERVLEDEAVREMGATITEPVQPPPPPQHRRTGPLRETGQVYSSRATEKPKQFYDL